ncbi:S-protein homolog 5-like [Neltuma alba]|uniref:S-protein homolog 5-like n=1 Tax=Neltuma alba TaxID=207710 RepID=UPI0010A2B261|nr:S-protein homolog 5-like [Prosopis alba]
MAPSLKLVLLLIAMVAAMSRGGKSGLLPPKTTVQIVNTLPNHQDLTLHCKDKNHDLGEHTLKFRETYEFKLKPNPLINVTLYFCSFWWPSIGPARYFDIYKQDRDKCKLCIWTVVDYGPCTSDGICYPWNPSQPHSTTLPSSHDVTTSHNNTHTVT